MTDHVTLTVVLRPADGGELPPDGVTVETLAQNAPEPQAVAQVQSFFAGRGFEVGPLVGIAFSITGPRQLAVKVFGDLPEVGALPLDRLPDDVREPILSVEAEAPLDFGPPSF
jgi:hypothetical protein